MLNNMWGFSFQVTNVSYPVFFFFSEKKGGEGPLFKKGYHHGYVEVGIVS